MNERKHCSYIFKKVAKQGIHSTKLLTFLGMGFRKLAGTSDVCHCGRNIDVSHESDYAL